MKLVWTILMGACFATSALASEELDFGVVITDASGEAIQDRARAPNPNSPCSAENVCPPFTLAIAAARALSLEEERDRIAPEEKLKRGALAVRLSAGGRQTLTAEDVILIKKAAAAAYPPVTYFRIVMLVDPASAK